MSAQTNGVAASAAVPNAAAHQPQMRPRNAARRVRTPNCTHIDMDRMYTRDQQCYVCGHTPSIGFLYVCRQDQHPLSLSAVSFEHVFAEEHHDCTKSELHHSLKEAGLSASVIEHAERGIYTDGQLQKLKAQKSELKQAIQDVIVGNQINAMAAQLATPTTQAPSSTDGTISSLPEKEQLVPTCTFRACHTCRPYYRDRVYASIPSIISNQQRLLTPEDASVLPTKNARVLRNIGLLPNPVPAEPPRDDEPLSPTTLPNPTDGTGTGDTGNITPSRASILTFRTTQTDISTVQRLSNPRKRFYSLGSRSSRSVPDGIGGAPSVTRKLKSAIRGIFNPRAESRKRIKTRVCTPRKPSKNRPGEKGREGKGEGEGEAEDGDVGLASVADTEPESSTITLPLPGTGTARDITAGQSGEKVGEFDVGSLRRIRRQKDSADLRNGVYAGGHQRMRISNKKSKSIRKPQRKASRKTPVSHRQSQSVNGTVDTRATPTIIGQKQRKNRNGTPLSSTRAASVSISSSVGDDASSDSESEFSVYSCSSEGEEVEVSGGVALTEEAVETHTPDILDTGKGAAVVGANGNAGLPLPLPLASGGIALPNGGFLVNRKGTCEVEGDETGDVGLQSIMAQV